MMELLILKFSHTPVILFLLGPNTSILLNALFSNTVSLRSSLNVNACVLDIIRSTLI
jgi:hypothetical protein